VVGAIRLEVEELINKGKMTGVSKMTSQKNGRIREVIMLIYNTNVRMLAIENNTQIENTSKKARITLKLKKLSSRIIKFELWRNSLKTLSRPNILVKLICDYFTSNSN
jgi:hypothetical protein